MKVWTMSSSLLVALTYLPAQGMAAPVLGSDLASFAVLGGSAVTSTGPTALIGNLGVSNNATPTGITGFFGSMANEGPGTVSGAVHQGDTFATTADSQLAEAKTSLSLMGAGTVLGANLGGLVLAPGVYTVAAGPSNLTGTLTLDGGGNANAFWVFQMPSTLITAPGSVVAVTNTGAGAGVYWNVGSAALLDANTAFAGNILANASISMNPGVTLNGGRALAHVGAVALLSDTINIGTSSGPGVEGSFGLSGGLTISEAGGTPVPLPFAAIPAPVPLPSALWALGSALGGIGLMRRRAT